MGDRISLVGNINNARTLLQGTPEDVYMLLGLHEAITPQRLRGLHSLLVYMKRQVRQAA